MCWGSCKEGEKRYQERDVEPGLRLVGWFEPAKAPIAIGKDLYWFQSAKAWSSHLSWNQVQKIRSYASAFGAIALSKSFLLHLSIYFSSGVKFAIRNYSSFWGKLHRYTFEIKRMITYCLANIFHTRAYIFARRHLLNGFTYQSFRYRISRKSSECSLIYTSKPWKARGCGWWEDNAGYQISFFGREVAYLGKAELWKFSLFHCHAGFIFW